MRALCLLLSPCHAVATPPSTPAMLCYLPGRIKGCGQRDFGPILLSFSAHPPLKHVGGPRNMHPIHVNPLRCCARTYRGSFPPAVLAACGC